MQVTINDVQLCVRQIPFNEVRLLIDCQLDLILNYLTTFVELMDQENFNVKIAPFDEKLRVDLTTGLYQLFGSGFIVATRIAHMVERTMFNLSCFGLMLYASSSESRSSLYE